MQLKNRVALITGAGRGIGRAISLAYAKEGAHLALAARSIGELEETAEQAQTLGASTCVIPVDVANQSQVEDMVQLTLDRFSRIDVLVNNAAIIGPVGALQDNEPLDWINTIQINLVGTFLCCWAVLPVMLRQDCGRIINLSGAGATSPWPYVSAYGTTKAAVVRFTETLAQELTGKNIQVNAMGPGGGIRTRMLDELGDNLKRAGYSEDSDYFQKLAGVGGSVMEQVAELAVLLASDTIGELSGRLITAVDDFPNLPPQIPRIMASESYTLRRVVPE